MNVTESNDVNTVLRWSLGLPDSLAQVPTPKQAEAAMMRLAQRASKTLGAGLTELDVHRWWINEYNVMQSEAGRGSDFATVTITAEDDAADVLEKITRVLDPVNDSVAWSFDARDATPSPRDEGDDE